MRNFFVLIVAIILFSVMAAAQDPGLRDSLIFGNLDNSPIIIGSGQEAAVPVWIKYDDSILFIHLPMATDDDYIESRNGGESFVSIECWEEQVFLPPDTNSPQAGYTSQGLMTWNDWNDLACPPPTYIWVHVIDFWVTASSDTAALGEITYAIEGYSPRNGDVIFGLPDGVSEFEPRIRNGPLRLYLSGDVNESHDVNGLDVTYLVNYLKGTGPPPEILISGDVNGSCGMNGIDIVYLVNYLRQDCSAPVYGECQ
jgi:hypothetical protein